MFVVLNSLSNPPERSDDDAGQHIYLGQSFAVDVTDLDPLSD